VVAPLYEEESALRMPYAMFTEESAGCHPEAASDFPGCPITNTASQPSRAGAALQALDIPVIAALNGVSDEGWLDYAVQLELAGAAALELSLYLAY
jgi:dihydroorotate dehydrogenase (fumarate)